MSESVVTIAPEHVDIPALLPTSEYPSLIVCAAQWSALLKSTPVSLVRRERDSGLVESLIDTPPGSQSAHCILAPESDHVALDLPSEHVSIDLTLVSDSTLGSGDTFAASTNQQRQQVPSNMCSSIEQLPTIMEDRSCLIGLTTEDRMPMSGVLGTAINESQHFQVSNDSPAFTARFLPKHVRNLSETPSLPPFHSSSTSSAYHSRNSSFGSQISSCFESDSCLNQQAQLTDVDSCIALHSGDSCGDTSKVFLRLPNEPSRLWGKASDGCYSSDLNLYCHMSSPLRAREVAPPLLAPDTLDDTLRAVRVPRLSLKERQEAAGMKSGEWLRRAMVEEEGEGVTQVKVSSKQVHAVPFSVKAGSIIIWEFATKKRDIAFGVSFEPTEVVVNPTPTQEPLHKLIPILPTLRISSHIHPAVGYHKATQDGIYEIIWDNSYSRFFAKDLYYRITTQTES
ncbi:hypothetical protein EMCRGX_G017786 [Ephydatia muelleri]